MKKQILVGTIVSLLLITTAASADSKVSLTYNYGNQTTETAEVFQIQPLSEIVGSNSTYHDLRLGYTIYENGETKGNVFLYGYTLPEKNKEMGFGLGAAANIHPDMFPKGLTAKLVGKAAVGWQDVGGQKKTISTNITKLTFITTQDLSQFKQPTKITYENNTYVINMGLSTGLSYDITDHLRIDADFTMNANFYQFAYRTEGNSNILNAMTGSQSAWITTVGLNYGF